NLWFTDLGTTKALGRITPNGTITEFTTGLNPAGAPTELTLGPDGNVWFLDPIAGSPAVGRVTPAGQITEDTTGLTPSSQPEALTAGADGNMWFTDKGNPAIGRVIAAGPTTGTITRFTTGLNPMSMPTAITTGDDGNVWFSDDGMTQAVGRVKP